MSKRIWNVALGRYEQVPDGIQLAGSSFTDSRIVSSRIAHFTTGKIMDTSRAAEINTMHPRGKPVLRGSLDKVNQVPLP